MADAAAKGRLHVSRPARQTISVETVCEIRGMVANGMTRKAVAEHFGIARSYVSEIVSGKRRQYDAPLTVALEKVG
jgi:predicted transcriptional regulator